MFVPDNLVGLIIGKGGETIKGINRSSGAIVFIPKEMNPESPERRLVRITHRYLKKRSKRNAFVEDPTEGYHHPEAW